MSDYISREDSLKAIKEMFRKSDMPDEWQSGVVDAYRLIEQIPAADAIEELSVIVRAQKAVLDKFPKWIPVTERLPEKYHQVLCYGVDGILTDYYSGETSVLGRPLFMVSEARVTHWMPLPVPPKEAD